MSSPHLAVVVPAYNEQERLGPTLEDLRAYLSRQAYSWAVWVVSDGSRDNTEKVAKDYSREHENVHLLAYHPNRGKGHAVKLGMMEIEADHLLMFDADGASPIEEVEKLWPKLDAGADVAIGSRPLKESNLEVRQPLYRELLGRAFNKAVQLMAVKGIDDTQCGFKLWKRDAARDVFQRVELEGFGFDFESLLIARDLGYRIAEVPIRWRHQEGSKVVLLRDGPRMLWDLVKLRLKGKRGRTKPVAS
ncbi:MAG: dolichyl-phosphate beta-glucosyltransferase [Fimbriimonadaceae bacterium]